MTGPPQAKYLSVGYMVVVLAPFLLVVHSLRLMSAFCLQSVDLSAFLSNVLSSVSILRRKAWARETDSSFPSRQSRKMESKAKLLLSDHNSSHDLEADHQSSFSVSFGHTQ
jgi:hypothetical protein